ncbi:uncharacterized protein TNCV_1099851 [Trichonephila clavipes]|nr:uncharacterized protein TNCV_1099851 [Trichonephila clavipes]
MWTYPAGSIRELESECHLQALQRFQDDGNVSRCYSTGRPRVTTPNEDRYIFGSYCQKKQNRHKASDLSRQLQPVRQFQGRPCTDA